MLLGKLDLRPWRGSFLLRGSFDLNLRDFLIQVLINLLDIPLLGCGLWLFGTQHTLGRRLAVITNFGCRLQYGIVKPSDLNLKILYPSGLRPFLRLLLSCLGRLLIFSFCRSTGSATIILPMLLHSGAIKLFDLLLLSLPRRDLRHHETRIIVRVILAELA